MNIKKLLALLLFMFILNNYCLIAIANQDESSEDEVVEERQKPDTPTTVRSGKRSDVNTLEEFIPSEEVSSDKPVAFPTDI